VQHVPHDSRDRDRRLAAGPERHPPADRGLIAIVVLVVREQLRVNRHGVTGKGTGPIGGARQDLAWAGTAALAVAVVGFGLSVAQASQPATDPQADVAQDTATTAPSGASTAARQVHPTTKLGNLTRFAVIVSDVQAKVAKNDLTGAKTRVKDLEVAWDDAEAGLKPRDATKWHQLDDQIDAVLTALRASNPTQADSASTVSKLMNTLNTFDGV
jgi:hypothetical protein